MRSEIIRFSTSLLAAVLFGGCESEQSLGPTDQESLSSARIDANIGAPSNLRAEVLAVSRIQLTWQDNSTNEKGFELLRSPDGSLATLQPYVDVPAGAVSYLDQGVDPSTTYCYAVRAFRTAGRLKSYSALSSNVCALTPAAEGAPPIPTNVTATSHNSTTISVGWTDNSQNETGFRIERATSALGPWVTAATLGLNQTLLLDGERTSETQICYRVTAFNLSGRSHWSQTACATPPAGPADLRASGSAPSSADLTWSDNSASEDGYDIQRADAHDGPYLVIADLPSNATAFHDDGLASDRTYWYQVRAKRAGGFSDAAGPSAAVTATTLPAAPTWLSASPLNGTWTDILWRDNSTNEEGYRMERSEAGGPWITHGSGGSPHSGGVSLWRDAENFPVETEICYRITAFNSLGESSDTGCTALPAVPVDLTAKVVDGVVELSWTDISSFEDGYYIVRADGMSMGFYYVYDGVGPNSTTYRDLSPDPEWSSYYLKAIKGPEGYSCCSNAVDVFMPTPGGS